LIRDYASVAEEHAARASSPLAAVGASDPERFDRLGRIQLAILKAEGLQRRTASSVLPTRSKSPSPMDAVGSPAAAA
jgi:hypothetical protein